MKKSLIYFSALLAFGLASCDDTSDLGVMQTNPQETVMVKDGVNVTLAAPVSGTALNLDQSGIIPVINYTVDATLPENATVDFVMELAKDASYADALEIPMEKVEGVENTYGVRASYWDDAFRHLLGKSPYAKDNYIRVAAYVCVDSQRSRIGGSDKWFADKKLFVTPVDLNIHVEDAYYLIGSLNGWQMDDTVLKFSHSDLSPFDDPVFTLAIDVPAELETAGCWWKIVPESAYQAKSWDGLFGTEIDGDTSLSGVLYENGQAGCLKVAGQYLFTINMLDCTYEVTSAIPMLYTPGNGNGWGFSTGMLDTWNYAEYFGFTHMNHGFKVTDRPAWGGIEWGAGDAEGTLKVGGPDIDGPADGLYWMTVNIGSLTYEFLPVETIGIIGGFPENSWDSDYAVLTPTDDILVLTADVDFTDANTDWKFRVNGDWAVNFGAGEEGVLSREGANLSAPGVGTYTITLDLRTVPYSYTAVKK